MPGKSRGTILIERAVWELIELLAAHPADAKLLDPRLWDTLSIYDSRLLERQIATAQERMKRHEEWDKP